MGKPYVIDIIKDQSGTWAVGTTFEDLTFSFSLFDRDHLPWWSCIPEADQYICFDSRPLLDLGAPAEKIYDVQLAYEGAPFTQVAAAQGGMLAHSYLEMQQHIKVHSRAAATANIDLAEHSLFRMVPAGILHNLFRLRGEMIFALRNIARIRSKDSIVAEKMPLLTVIRRIELAGVHADISYTDAQLELSNLPHETQFFKGVLSRGDMLYTRYSPVGVKTGRLKVDHGFNTMGIPHGPCRDSIVSRHLSGLIYDFDFNAIDYRCIVNSISDEWFRELYADCEDFHSRTREIVGDLSVTRDEVKAMTYIYIYGGSEKTIVQSTGLSPDKVQDVLKKFDEKFWPIEDFRERLHEIGQRLGYVTLPTTYRVPVASDDHPGKVLGLYAQSYSSWVFEQALTAVDTVIQKNGLKSRIIFPVHDEIVMDIPAEEEHMSPVFQDAMEWAGTTRFRVKMKKGRTYGDATDRN